jgi:hypothetical protein
MTAGKAAGILRDCHTSVMLGESADFSVGRRLRWFETGED